MAARIERFVDRVTELLESVNSQKVRDMIENDLPQIISLLDEEKSASMSYADAWSHAADSYSAQIEKAMPEDYKTQVDKKLLKNLPEDLKANQSFVPIAVTICTQEPSEFFAEFNKATQEMLSNEAWDSFSFKSLYMLLHLAVKFLPSRPGPNMNRTVFRGLDTDQVFEMDQTVSFGYFASFTPRRFLALGRSEPLNKRAGANEEDEADNDDEGDATEDAEGGAPLTKTVFRVDFKPEVSGLGLRFLSEYGDAEREVLVMAEQTFKVVEIKKKPKKGFQVVVLKPL